MLRSPAYFAGVGILSSLIAQSLLAQEWSRFRGPNGAGVSESTTVPTAWTEEDFNWRIKLPGVGHSSPVIWGEKLFVTSAEEDAGERYLLCIDTTDGSERWRRAYPLPADRKHKNNSHASNSPAVDANHVYALWQSRNGSALYALDHAGNEVWQFDLGPFRGGHGSAVSPIVHDDLVIVPADQDAGSFLTAVDVKTGKERWRVERESTRATYSTPCIFDPPDRPAEIIFTDMHHGITAVDPATGRVNWEISVFGTFNQRAIASPVIAGGLIIGASGFTTAQKNVVAVQPMAADEGVSVKESYRLSRSVPHIPSPLVYRDWMFLLSDTGIMSCVLVADGKLVWQERIGGNYMSSPVCIGGNLYCADDRGEVVVVAAADKFKLVGRNPLGDGTRATPAVSDGVMYARTFSELISLGRKKPAD